MGWLLKDLYKAVIFISRTPLHNSNLEPWHHPVGFGSGVLPLPQSVSRTFHVSWMNPWLLVCAWCLCIWLHARRGDSHTSAIDSWGDIFLRVNLDLQPLVCLSSCLFCLHSQAMANVSPPPRRLFLPSSRCWAMVAGYPYLCKAHGGISPSVLTSKLTVHTANTLARSSSRPG